MSARVVALLLLAACGPSTAAEGVRASGGVDPVICYKVNSGLSACRDGVGSFWICTVSVPINCVRAEEPAKVFALPEQPARAP